MDILRINNIHIDFKTSKGITHAVNGASLTLEEGEILAICGESGSGKTALAGSIMGLNPSNCNITGGTIEIPAQDRDRFSESSYEYVDIIQLEESEKRKLRSGFASMVFQDPLASLDPTMTIGSQIEEAIRQAGKQSKAQLSEDDIRKRVHELLMLVGIDKSEERALMYPCAFSGGMRQRVVIAMAIAKNSRLIIADEPTTSLDVSTQQDIINLFKKIRDMLGTSILFITHDLSIVPGFADRIAVMHDGSVIETGDAYDILRNPKEEYTKQLIDAAIMKSESRELQDETLLKVEHLSQSYRINRKKRVNVLKDISFELHKGEILGIIGDSGSGKSTILKCLMNLIKPDSGKIIYKGINVLDKYEYRQNKNLLESDRQMILQDAGAAINHRMTVSRIITEPLEIQGKKTARGDYRSEAVFQLSYVGMTEDYADKYPSELSGGQRQRVQIARALTMEPGLLLADEPVSSLDLRIQKQVTDLIRHMRDEHGCSIIFVTHDLRCAMMLCDRIAVIDDGRLTEIQDANNLLSNPQSEAAKKLVSAIPANIEELISERRSDNESEI